LTLRRRPEALDAFFVRRASKGGGRGPLIVRLGARSANVWFTVLNAPSTYQETTSAEVKLLRRVG
jgi:hypothetical protein